MANAYFDGVRRGGKDRPGFRLPDHVAALNRTYVDQITVPTDQVKLFPKEERAGRNMLSFAELEPGTHELTLTQGYKLTLDSTGSHVAETTKELVIKLEAFSDAAAVFSAIAAAVNGWNSLFQAVLKNPLLGIYDAKGRFAITAYPGGWSEVQEEDVPLLRPGLPPDCIPGTYHPECSYLMLVDVSQGQSTDTHTDFHRTWQVDLNRLSEFESIDLEALLEQGKIVVESVEKETLPPRQFLPWIKTETQLQKAPRGAAPDGTTDSEDDLNVTQSSITQENLASAARQTVRTSHGLPEPLVAWVIDRDTGELRAVTQEVVASDVMGEEVRDDGRFSEVQPVNTLWSIRTTEQAAGLAGNAVNGYASRTWDIVMNYSWPPVLDYIFLQPVHTDPGNIYSEVEGWMVAPIFLVDAYSGPCRATVVDTWTIEKPRFDGDENWPASGTAPKLITPVEMLPREIEFNGTKLRVNVKPCLHASYRFWENGYSQSYPATPMIRWPATVVASVELQPEFGGWRTRTILVHAPSIKGVSTGLDLTVAESNASSFSLEWTPGTSVKLMVSTDPLFNSNFVSGFNGTASISGNTQIVTGIVPGMIYYCQVIRGAVKSNIVAAMTEPMPELKVKASESATNFLTSGESSVWTDTVELGATGSIDLVLMNTGLLKLTSIRASLSGEDEAMFTLGTVASTIAPNGTAKLRVSFSPTDQGVRSTTLTITSNTGTPFTLQLEGYGTAPEIAVEVVQPAPDENLDLTSGDTVDFGVVTSAPITKTLKLLNIGNATMRRLALNMEGANAGDYTVEPLGSPELAAGATVLIPVTFDPADSEDASYIRKAQLQIPSNDDDDDENPFIINLTGLYEKEAAPGLPDETFTASANGPVYAAAFQTDGKLVIGGNFTQVGETTRTRLARLNTDGSVDEDLDLAVNDAIRAIAIQEDGKILLGGEFTSVDGTTRNRIARINADGTLDEDFDPNADAAVLCLGLQPDGKIIAGGSFSAIGGGAKAWLARLSNAGTLDTGFTSLVNNTVHGLNILADGKVMVVGEFETPIETTEPPTTTSTTGWTSTSTSASSTTTTAGTIDPEYGTLMSTYCSGFDYMGVYADGTGGTYDQLIEANSSSCGYIPPPASGTFLRTECSGYDLYNVYADGMGGEYSSVAEYNSASCGYTTTTEVLFPPYGTLMSTGCMGYDLVGYYSDGTGGQYSSVIEYNSTSCGYAP